MSKLKESKNKKKKIKIGRPKGSKNKIKKPEKLKKRGRPKKLKDSKLSTEIPEILIPIPKAYKFIGYCSKCHSIISSNDLVSKLIYICLSCGKRAHTKILRSKRKSDKSDSSNKSDSSDSNKFQSKKDYLETVSSSHHETSVLNNENRSLENIRVEINR